MSFGSVNARGFQRESRELGFVGREDALCAKFVACTQKGLQAPAGRSGHRHTLGPALLQRWGTNEDMIYA